MSRANQWFVPGDGIAREVITADIQRYLGPDALVRPGHGTGEYEGRAGYWITAYRTLTSQMILDLKQDSQRWQQERDPRDPGRGSPYAPSAKVAKHPDTPLVAYQDSRTHAARQHWGPSEGLDSGAARQPARQTYAASSAYETSGQPHYTTTPTAYGSSHQAHSAYGVPASAPRTQPQDSYANYPSNSGRDHPTYAPTQSAYGSYGQPVAQDPYGRAVAPTPSHTTYAASTPSTAAPGYYIASDGRQYPLAQQPQQQQQPQQGRRR